MSTRACLARLLALDHARFRGILVEENGRPTEMGGLLLAYLAGGGSLQELIDKHPSGWKSFRRGECLCAPGREPVVITELNALAMDVRFVYAFGGGHMVVLGRWLDVRWVVLAAIPLDGPAPDWSAIEAEERRYH